MRLVDGDRLLMKLKQNHLLFIKAYGDFSNFSEKDKARIDEIDNCIAEIINAPTIDPEDLRPKGRWILEAHDKGCLSLWEVTAECSNCHAEKTKVYDGCITGFGEAGGEIACEEAIKFLKPYCPFCGALMEDAE